MKISEITLDGVKAYLRVGDNSDDTIASDGKTIFKLGNTRYLSIRGINI